MQHDLQEMMQDLVGIVRNEDEMRARSRTSKAAGTREPSVGVTGNREYNPGWHTALDLNNLLTVSEAITRRRSNAKKAAAAHFREDFPNKDEQSGR